MRQQLLLFHTLILIWHLGIKYKIKAISFDELLVESTILNITKAKMCENFTNLSIKSFDFLFLGKSNGEIHTYSSLIGFPHCLCCTWLSVCDCFINAEAVTEGFFFVFAACMRSNILCGAQVSCCHPVSQGPSDWFCSSDTCHPVSSLPKVCFLSPLLQHKDWGLGLTCYCYKPTSYLFSLPALDGWWDFFFLLAETKFLRSLGKKSWMRKQYLCWHG